jgi:hypothetical protein
MVPVFFGGLLRWWTARRSPTEADRESRIQRGVLFGSGLVGGEGILGVGIAVGAVITSRAPEGIGPEWAGAAAPWLAAGVFALLALWFWSLVRGAGDARSGGAGGE